MIAGPVGCYPYGVITTEHLQYASATLWFATSWFLWPSLLRSLFGTPRHCDSWRSTVLVASFLFIAFPTRSLFLPNDVSGRMLLYYISMGLAMYVLVQLWNGRRQS